MVHSDRPKHTYLGPLAWGSGPMRQSRTGDAPGSSVLGGPRSSVYFRRVVEAWNTARDGLLKPETSHAIHPDWWVRQVCDPPKNFGASQLWHYDLRSYQCETVSYLFASWRLLFPLLPLGSGFALFRLKTVSVRFEFCKFSKVVLLRGEDVVNYLKSHTANGLSWFAVTQPSQNYIQR